MKCGICGSAKNVKKYIIADDMENPKARCKKCMDELFYEILNFMCDKNI